MQTTMPIEQREVEKACEYAAQLYTDKRGPLISASPDKSFSAVTIMWANGTIERYSSDTFVEKMKSTAAKFGDNVEF